MSSVVAPVGVDWLVTLVNAYSPQAADAAGHGAVRTERADDDQPAVAARVSGATKTHLAEVLWPVFAGPTTEVQIEALDALLVAASLSPRLDADGRRAWETSLKSPADRLTAACAACLLEAVGTYGWSRLGACDGCDCADVYVDHARRSPRRYCSTTCLNRAKIRAFRSRRSAP